MILAPSAYLAVITTKMDASVVCIDASENTLLSENVTRIESLRVPKLNPAKKYYSYFQNDGKGPGIPNEYDSLSPLFLQAHLPAKTYYMNEVEFESEYEDRLILPTDLLTGLDGTTNLAASRNILLFGIELKGVGRNFGAVRLDYPHAWGGMYLAEAIIEFLSSNICDFSCHLGAERTILIGLHGKNCDSPHFKSNSFIIRKRSAPRVSQACRQFEDELSRKTFESISRSDESAIQNHIRQITFQYLTLGQIGMMHTSLIPENAIINGKLIDTNSIHMSEAFNSLKATILLSVNGDQLNKVKTLSDLKTLGDEVSFSVENNSIRNTYEVIFKTYLAFKLQAADIEIHGASAKAMILKIIKELIQEMGGDSRVADDFISFITLPHKKTLSADEFKHLIQQLESQTLTIDEFKPLLIDGRTIFKIIFQLDPKWKIDPIVSAFNQAQFNSLEKFIHSLSRMLSLIDMNDNSLFHLLNNFVLNSVKLLPFTLDEGLKVRKNIKPRSELESFLGKDVDVFQCFIQEGDIFLKKKLSRQEILNEKGPLIIYGFDKKVIHPAYFNGKRS